jgi:hypothetical protein
MGFIEIDYQSQCYCNICNIHSVVCPLTYSERERERERERVASEKACCLVLSFECCSFIWVTLRINKNSEWESQGRPDYKVILRDNSITVNSSHLAWTPQFDPLKSVSSLIWVYPQSESNWLVFHETGYHGFKRFAAVKVQNLGWNSLEEQFRWELVWFTVVFFVCCFHPDFAFYFPRFAKLGPSIPSVGYFTDNSII